MKRVVFDVEADGLVPSQVWCICTEDIDTGETNEFYGETLKDFASFASEVGMWVGHNIYGYDIPVLTRLLGVTIDNDSAVDTLVLSRLAHSERGRKHSLEAWGKLLGFEKQGHDDWSQFSPAMLNRCRTDVAGNKKLYLQLLKDLKGFSKYSIKMELDAAKVCNKISRDGFYLDIRKTQDLFIQLSKLCTTFLWSVALEFPPIPKPRKIPTYTPHKRKDGTVSAVGLREFPNWETEISGDPFCWVDWQPFNLSSPVQIVKRLDMCGWKPFEKTKTGKSFALSEANLETIPDTAPKSIRALKDYMINKDRLSTVEGWLKLVSPADSRLRGQIISTGATTHRCAHRDFQMANIPSVDGKWGREMRSYLTVDGPDRRLVGADAAGIQLRVLAHHLGDPVWQQAMLDGDIHQYNADLIGIPRSVAKTFIYAFLLGAGNYKLGLITGGGTEAGKQLKAKFFKAIPSLSVLKEKAEVSAKRRVYRALDGRLIPVPNSHLAPSVFLQGDEQAIMKKAMILLDKQFERDYLDAKIVAFVHDEFQIDCHKEVADKVGMLSVNSIIRAGQLLKCRCPLAGEYKIGRTWADTH